MPSPSPVLSGYYVDPLADVKTKNIGEGSKVWQFSVVLLGASIGTNTNICSHCFIENDVIVGNNVTVKCGVYLWDGMSIEDNVFIGPNVTFTNDVRPRSKQYPEAFKRIHIGKGASIGANATVLGGLSIGAYAMIGMGAVVTKDVPAHTLWYGNPATLRGYVCTCGEKLNEELYCEPCKQLFVKEGSGLKAI